MSRSGPRRGSGGGGAPLPSLQEEDAQSPASSAAYRGGGSGAGGSGGVFKQAAIEVLRRTRRLMATGEICRLALDWGLLACSGKTPEATMASALYGDVKRREAASPFIRPQEGLFGLREWADPGRLPPSWHHPPLPHHPHWQPHIGASLGYSGLAAGGLGAPAADAAQGPGVAGLAGLGPPLHAAAASVAGSAAPLGSQGAAPAPQAVPSSARSGGASTAVRPPVPKGRGRHKRARRASTHEEDDDDEWSCGSGSQSDLEQEGGSDADDRLEPRSYALRKGQVGRLRQAAAASGAPSRRAPSQEAAPAAALPLDLLELPRLRPSSAEGSQLGSQRLGSAGAGSGLLSPPLYTALQSPRPHPPAASSGAAASRPRFPSPASTMPPYQLSSPLVPLPSLATPAGLPGLLSPLGGAAQRAQHEPCPTSLPPQAAAVGVLKASAAGCASLAPSAPGTALSAVMVPVCEAASLAAAAAAQQAELPAILPLDMLQQPQLWVSAAAAAATAAGAGAGAPPPLGAAPQVVFRPLQGGKEGEVMQIHVYASGQLPALTSEALCSGSFDIVPSHGPGELGGTAAGLQAAAAADGGGGGGGGAAAAIARKIAEVEGKVAAVEARWGPLSLKTGRAHFLLHHACRHPAAAAAYRGQGEAALQRAQEILQHHSQMGLGGSDADEFAALLQGIRSAGPGAL